MKNFLAGYKLHMLIPGLILILVSTLLFFFGRIMWPWGWAVGTVLVIFSGKSDSEKKGYRF